MLLRFSIAWACIFLGYSTLILTLIFLPHAYIGALPTIALVVVVDWLTRRLGWVYRVGMRSCSPGAPWPR